MLSNHGAVEDSLESLGLPVNPKGNQSWIFIGRTDAEAETPILWPPDVKNWLTGKDPNAGKDWRQEEKGMTENKMVRWHHRLNGHEFCASSGSWWWWAGKPVMLQSMGSQSQTRLSNWTELILQADTNDNKHENNSHFNNHNYSGYVKKEKHWYNLILKEHS